MDHVTTWPEVISAIGAVIVSCLVPYLVHRRILADRETKHHRENEDKVHKALVEKLQLEIVELQKPKPRKR